MNDEPPDYFDQVPAQGADVVVSDGAPVTKVTEGPANPFQRARSEHLAEGAVEIESQRAIAEAQGKMVIAKRFPRDEEIAFERMLVACARPTLAAVAFYNFGRGRASVSGPSIRLAEELQRCWGNMESGLRELSRKPGLSEMEAFAWDYETNNLSTQRFTVRHIRDLKEGHADLTSERDIYEITANMGQRRVRARILAVIPSDYVERAIAECKKTLAGGSKIPLEDRIRGAITRFREINVTAEMLATMLGHPLGEVTADEIVNLTGIFNSIKDGMSKVSDHFGASATPAGSKSKLEAFEEAHGKKQAAPSEAPETGETKEKAAPTVDTSEPADGVYAPVRAKTYKVVKEWQKDVMVLVGNLGTFADVDELKADHDFVKHMANVHDKAKSIAQEIDDAIEDRITLLMARQREKEAKASAQT